MRVVAFLTRFPRPLTLVLVALGVLAVWGLGVREALWAPAPLAGAFATALLAVGFAYVALRALDPDTLPRRERLLQVIDALPWALLLTDAGEILYANPAAHRLLGVPEGTLVGRHLLDGVDPADRPEAEAWLAASREAGPVPACTLRVGFVEEGRHPVRVQGARVAYGGQEVLEVLLTDRSAEQRAQAEVERLASFPQLNPDPIVEIGLQGELQYANAAARRLLPDVAEQGDGHPYLRALPSLREALQNGRRVATAEVAVGERVYEQVAILTPDGRSVRVYGRDITRREQILRSLHVSEDRFARLFRLSPVAMGLSRLRDGTLLDVNESFAQLLGYETAEEIIGRRSGDVLWEDEAMRQRIADLLRQVRRITPRLMTIRTRTGEMRRVIVSAEVIEVDGFACVSSMLIDVEEQERLRQRVEEERDFALSIVETAGMGLIISDPTFKIRYVNKRLLNMTGYTAEEVYGMDPVDFMLPEDRGPVVETRLERQGEGRERIIETRMRCKDGTERDVLVAIVPRMEAGQYVGTTSVVIDVTEQRQAAREVKRLRFFYENILHDLPLEVAVLDADGRFLFLNQMSVPDPAMRQALIGKNVIESARLRGFDLTLYERRQAWLDEVIASKQDGQIEEVFARPEGDRVVLRVARPVLDAGGEVAYVIGYGLDITERKQVEVELIHARDRAEELSALKSSFIANMSHEVRTPLTAVIGFAEVLQEEIESPELREVAVLIRESGRRLLETLNSVLELARMQAGALELRLEPSPLVPSVKTTVDLFRPLAERKGLALHLDIADASVAACVDLPAFNRIMNNLLSNAIKFTDEGEVRVFIGREAEQAVVRVSDTGVGIEEAFFGRLFEEFQQESSGLARSHPGSGLGLAIVRRLVHLMHGTITVESRKREGSVFTLALPATAG